DGIRDLIVTGVQTCALPISLKIAARARTIADSVRLLKVAGRSRNLVAVPLGEVGLPARLLALREGSELSYAPVEQATAPGQISLKEMLQLYRSHLLTRLTRVYGVIGDPIGHSLSPLQIGRASCRERV